MGKNHTSTRRGKSLLEKFREQCKREDAPCWLCPKPIDYEAEPTEWKNDWRFQRDHFYPVSTHPHLEEDWDNFRASHAKCNRDRSNKPPRPAIGNRSQAWV